MAGDGCALAVRAGVGVDLRCRVAGPEENKKKKSVRFSAQKLLKSNLVMSGGPTCLST